jgi:hypothetical protein
LAQEINFLWPKSHWHSLDGFRKVLRIYREYTTGDCPTAKQNRYSLGFWQISPFRVSYSLSKLMWLLGRSRSSINAAFTACGWLVRPIAEEELWESALHEAVPHLTLRPHEARTWTTREMQQLPSMIDHAVKAIDGAEETETRAAVRGKVRFPPCESLEFRP